MEPNKPANMEISDLNKAANIVLNKYHNDKKLVSLLEKYYNGPIVNKELAKLLSLDLSEFETQIFDSGHCSRNRDFLLYLINTSNKYFGCSGFFSLVLKNKEVIFNTEMIIADCIDGFRFGVLPHSSTYSATLYMCLKIPKNKERLNEFIISRESRDKFMRIDFKSHEFHTVEIPIKIYNRANKTEHIHLVHNIDYKIKIDSMNNDDTDNNADNNADNVDNIDYLDDKFNLEVLVKLSILGYGTRHNDFINKSKKIIEEIDKLLLNNAIKLRELPST